MFACRRTNETARLAPTAASFHVEVGSGPPRGPRGGEFCCSSAKQICRLLSCLRRCRTKPPACVFGLCWCAESRTARVDGSDGRELEAQPQLLVDFLSFRFDLSRWKTFAFCHCFFLFHIWCHRLASGLKLLPSGPPAPVVGGSWSPGDQQAQLRQHVS